MSDIVDDLRSIADASKRTDGSDIPLGEQVREAADLITRLRAEVQALQQSCTYLTDVTVPQVRAEAFERAAQIAEWPGYGGRGKRIAALIRHEAATATSIRKASGEDKT